MIEGATKTAVEECLKKHGYERQRIGGKNPDRWIHPEHGDFVADLSGEKPVVGVEVAGMIRKDGTREIHEDGHGRTAIGDVQMAVAQILEQAEKTKNKAEPKPDLNGFRSETEFRKAKAEAEQMDVEGVAKKEYVMRVPPGEHIATPEEKEKQNEILRQAGQKFEQRQSQGVRPLGEQQDKPAIIPAGEEKPVISQPEQKSPEVQKDPEKKGKWVQCKKCGEDTFITGEEALKIRDELGGLFCEKHRQPEPLGVTQERAKEHEKEHQDTTDSKNKGDKMNENKSTEVLPVPTAAEPALSINVIKQYLCPEATDAEAYNFLQLCVHRKLNPFLREAYLVKYKGAAATMIVGKDAFYRKAQESGKLKGIESGIIVRDPTGAIVEREGMFMYPAPDEKSKGDVLLGGWAKVYRTDQEKPTVVKVGLNEYIKVVDGRPQRNWATMPATMICKVAKVQALRESFTTELGGCYDAAELGEENR